MATEDGNGLKQRVLTARNRLAGSLSPWHWLAPLGAFYVPFLVAPIATIFVLSLFTWTSPADFRFVGLAHYRSLLGGDILYVALRNTAAYTLGNTVLTVGGGLALALIIQGAYRRVRALLQTAYLLPYAIMPVGVGLIWALMYHPQIGAVNEVIDTLGIDANPLWLGDTALVLPAIVLAGAWQSVGFYTVIWLVGLASIDPTYHEAARIDGAGPVSRFRYITLPLLKPIGLFLVVISLITSLRIFGLVWIMTRGGPGRASEVMVTWMYRTAFIENNLGRAAAIGVILFGITLAVSFVLIRAFGITEDS
ncbi:ABC transporter permease subunit [Halorubrum sp. JWXQ-INN 858]|uniref:carbohydrate ABC transporter permease n=1 Tax=Halorubrum sp. JWXQ-INN 858 TaxID=2690782 RepID=UPI00135AF971|nr:sugar ABC transporter permease [Halorubrum sp. JWXQ-INN 858]MWV64394.1 ABC transporter permease subunit [Halorubrum sp. JWXQ-INN 858]